MTERPDPSIADPPAAPASADAGADAPPASAARPGGAAAGVSVDSPGTDEPVAGGVAELAPLRAPRSARGGLVRRWGLWVAIVAVAVAALVAGADGGDDGPRTPAARAAAIAAEVRCPTCRGLSAAESDAKAARAVRTEIRRRVDAGDTDAEIKDYLASRYGDDILLRPPATGAGALVWAVPVAGFVVAAAGLGFAFRRWRLAPGSSPEFRDRDAAVDGVPADASGNAGPTGGPADAAADDASGGRGATGDGATDGGFGGRAADADVRTEDAPGGGAVPAGRMSTRRTALVAAVVALVAVGAGVALAAAAGDRRAGDPLTGAIEGTSAARDPRLDQAQEFIGTGKAVEAVKLYDAILRDDPDQVEALAYRGWLLRLAGLPDEGLVYLDRAVAADPSYPDAHFFRGMVLWQDKGDPAAGAAEFRLFLANDPPQAMVGLVEDALNRALAEAAAKGQSVPTSTTAAAAGDPEGG